MSDKVSLTAEEMAEVRKIVDEIMLGQDRMHNPAVFRQYAEDVLVRHLTAAVQEYADQEAAELTHKWEFGPHPVSTCRPDLCGRYRGQRRDSHPVPAHTADDCHLVNCVWHPSAPLAPDASGQRRDSQWNTSFPAPPARKDPPPMPFGPASHCQRCARSGVGVCDDYPDCPAGRAPKPCPLAARWPSHAPGVLEGCTCDGAQ